MPVAKSYLDWKTTTEPFKDKGRMYVWVKSPTGVEKKVRWYTKDEWLKMYPELAYLMTGEKTDLKAILGFGEAGYITIYYGDTYANLDWFKAAPECRYHKVWGWYTPSAEPVSAILPDGVKTAELTWENVTDENGELSEAKAKETIDAIVYEPSTSEFVGTIGDRDEFELTVTKTLTFANQFGYSTMHLMEDVDGNVFVWTTSSKKMDEDTTYLVKGTIKDHRTYKNVNQTILTRCKVLKELD